MKKKRGSKKKCVRVFQDGGLTYRLELVRCGRNNCGKCPHGPYWYVYGRRNGKGFCRYIGKTLMKKEKLEGVELRSVEEEQKMERATHPELFNEEEQARMTKGGKS